jgi:hypothetical protein
MGLLTDFFVASESEIASTFPGWLPCSAEDCIKKDQNTHPPKPKGFLTRLKSFFSFKQPVAPETQLENDTPSPDITVFPHFCYKRIDILKLGTLFEILTGINNEDAFVQIEDTSLAEPENGEQVLFRLPDTFTNALANISETEIEIVTKKWALTEEFQETEFTLIDIKEVITALSNLAQNSLQNNKHLYHLWSL